jgi:hypothetical protein
MPSITSNPLSISLLMCRWNLPMYAQLHTRYGRQIRSARRVFAPSVVSSLLITRTAVEVLTPVASIIPLIALYQVFNAIITGGIMRARGQRLLFYSPEKLEVRPYLKKLVRPLGHC